MNIIISHDVDHLYPSDHIFRDLIFPKLWIRSFIELSNGNIGFKNWYYRLISVFDKRLNRIPEIIEFDKKHEIPSVFFFAMNNILGMSYKKNSATTWIKFVIEEGFDTGVHGAEFENVKKMQNEFNDFKKISNLNSFGIRTHYVRFNNNTFRKMAELGYYFDTSEFNKKEIELKPPYKVEKMWEFPLYLMDGYILKNNSETAKKLTINALDKARGIGLKYFTFLFHDYLFNEKTYSKEKDYYEWFVNYCENQHLGFISYRTAIDELERSLKHQDE